MYCLLLNYSTYTLSEAYSDQCYIGLKNHEIVTYYIGSNIFKQNILLFLDLSDHMSNISQVIIIKKSFKAKFTWLSAITDNQIKEKNRLVCFSQSIKWALGDKKNNISAADVFRTCFLFNPVNSKGVMRHNGWIDYNLWVYSYIQHI